MQCSAGKRRLRSNPCRTERMLGRWTNCSTKRWLWNRQSPMHLAHHNICYTYPQHCICLNITVLYPTLHQYKHCHTVLAQTSLYCIAHYTSTNTALAQTSLYCIPHYTSANTALAQTSQYCIPHYTSTNTATLYLPKHHCTVSHTTPLQTLPHCTCPNITVLYPTLHQYKHATYTAASGDGDLDGVTPPRAHILQVERFVGWLVLSPLNVKRGCVDTDGDGGWPVGVLLPVLMVETLQLQLQVWPAHITNTASFNSLFTSLSVHIITNTASFNSLFTVCAHHLLTAYSLSVHIITNTTSVNNLLSLHIITNTASFNRSLSVHITNTASFNRSLSVHIIF